MDKEPIHKKAVIQVLLLGFLACMYSMKIAYTICRPIAGWALDTKLPSAWEEEAAVKEMKKSEECD